MVMDVMLAARRDGGLVRILEVTVSESFQIPMVSER
jgi:hypothetical protein